MPTKREKFEAYRDHINKMLDKMSALIVESDEEIEVNNFDSCFSELTDNDIIQIILSKSVATLVEQLHFNSERPQECNICRTDKNRHDQAGLLRENGQWVRCNSRKLAEDIFKMYFQELSRWARKNSDLSLRNKNNPTDDTVGDIWNDFVDSGTFSSKGQIGLIFELLYSKKNFVKY